MTTSTITRESVANAMTEVGYGQYVGYADLLAANLQNAGTSTLAVRDFARQRGVTLTDSAAQRFLEALQGGGSEPVDSTPTEVGFDRENACNVIRAFITLDDENGAYTTDEVDALLILAGLMDEPVIEEPVAEVEDADGGDDTPQWARGLISTVESLVNFAKGHGYRI